MYVQTWFYRLCLSMCVWCVGVCACACVRVCFYVLSLFFLSLYVCACVCSVRNIWMCGCIQNFLSCYMNNSCPKDDVWTASVPTNFEKCVAKKHYTHECAKFLAVFEDIMRDRNTFRVLHSRDSYTIFVLDHWIWRLCTTIERLCWKTWNCSCEVKNSDTGRLEQARTSSVSV